MGSAIWSHYLTNTKKILRKRLTRRFAYGVSNSQKIISNQTLGKRKKRLGNDDDFGFRTPVSAILHSSDITEAEPRVHKIQNARNAPHQRKT